MIESSSLPGDPSELHLRVYYDDEFWDTPQADTLERWNVAVLHRRRTHGGGQGPAAPSSCITPDCCSCTVEDTTVGSLTSTGVHLDRDRNAYFLPPSLERQMHALTAYMPSSNGWQGAGVCNSTVASL
ncbi:hypothetical protein [Streptomyces sp. TRM68367]|uniref:hypothetical protein n=1 Tax=Streptomyces sp. TRM68367 TaxID=2758415 RepID=UPI00165AF1B4|nr:hypothetical protein [Streptomyces sp. TRM68367]MBC9723780.1 hypothetical protein [Streptomyces sp. TRM68367]